MKKLDLTKPVQMKNGKPAKIVDTDAVFNSALKGPWVVARAVDNCDSHVYVAIDSEGLAYDMFGNHIPKYDIVNVPEKRVLYFNIYSWSGQGVMTAYAHSTRDAADWQAGHDRIACVRVEAVEGQFDE